MDSLPTVLETQLSQAHIKVRDSRSILRYLISTMLAGTYIGIAVILMVTGAGPYYAQGSPAVGLISGAVFGMALTLCVFAGAELVTSAMMILPQGALLARISWQQAGGTLLFCYLGNFAGSVVFALLIVASGILEAKSGAGAMLQGMLDGKAAASNVELFTRGILCNILVCLAIWSANRLKTESGKAIIIFWCVLAFITSGFEHVVANMTSFTIGLVSGDFITSGTEMARNLVIVGLGNLVGGAVFVGFAYAVVAGGTKQKELLDAAATATEQ